VTTSSSARVDRQCAGRGERAQFTKGMTGHRRGPHPIAQAIPCGHRRAEDRRLGERVDSSTRGNGSSPISRTNRSRRFGRLLRHGGPHGGAPGSPGRGRASRGAVDRSSAAMGRGPAAPANTGRAANPRWPVTGPANPTTWRGRDPRHPFARSSAHETSSPSSPTTTCPTSSSGATLTAKGTSRSSPPSTSRATA